MAAGTATAATAATASREVAETDLKTAENDSFVKYIVHKIGLYSINEYLYLKKNIISAIKASRILLSEWRPSVLAWLPCLLYLARLRLQPPPSLYPGHPLHAARRIPTMLLRMSLRCIPLGAGAADVAEEVGLPASRPRPPQHDVRGGLCSSARGAEA